MTLRYTHFTQVGRHREFFGRTPLRELGREAVAALRGRALASVELYQMLLCAELGEDGKPMRRAERLSTLGELVEVEARRRVTEILEHAMILGAAAEAEQCRKRAGRAMLTAKEEQVMRVFQEAAPAVPAVLRIRLCAVLTQSTQELLAAAAAAPSAAACIAEGENTYLL